MKQKELRLTRESLLARVDLVARMQAGKSTVKAYSLVTIAGDDQSRAVVSGAGDLGRIVLPIELAQMTPGEPIIADTQALRAKLASMRGSTVELARKGTQLVLTCDRATATLDLDPEAEALTSETHPNEGATNSRSGKLMMDAGDLLPTLARVSHAAARESGRYAMNSVMVQLEGDALEVVATDGRRLAIESVKAEAHDWTCPAPLMLPREAVTGILPAALPLICGSAPLTIQLYQRRVEFAGLGGSLSLRDTEGEFPRYRAVIPKAHKSSIKYDVREMLAAVKFAASSCTPDAMAIALEAGDDGTVSVSSRRQGSSSTDQVDAEIDGKPPRIALNPQFLGDALKAAGDGKCSMQLNGKTEPAALDFDAIEGFRVVLMPITVET